MADITNDRSRVIYNNAGQAIFGGSNAVIWVNPAAGNHAGVNFRQDGTFKGFVGFNNSSSCVNLSMDGSIADGINVNASHDVMIGTTTSQGALTVVGATQTVVANLTANSSIGLSIMGTPTNNFTAISLGEENALNNAAVWRFKYNGDHSTSNYLGLGFYANDDILNIAATKNVGIGTDSPNHKLDIQVDSNVALRLHRFNSALDTTEPIGIGFSHRGDTANSTTDTRAGIFSSYNGDLFFSVDQGGRVDDDPIADSAMFIDGAAGNIGIGTISPTQLLTIGDSSGNSFIDINKSTSGENGIIFNNAGNRKLAIIQNSSEHLEFHTNNNNVRMIIQEGGNVGIANTSPGQKLDVAGNVVIRGGGSHLANSGVGELKLGYAFASSGGTAGSATRLAIQPYAHTGGPFIFVARDTSSEAFLDIGYNAAHLTLKHDGKLGIGVTSPGHVLDVSGNIRLQGGDRKIVFNNGSVECSLDQMNGGVGGLGTLARFGVGTIAPNNTLQVVGNITIGTGATNEAVRTIMTGGTLNLQATDANHRIIIRGTQDTSGTITGNTNNMDFYEFGGYNFYSGVNTGTGARNLALTIDNNGIAGFGATGIYAGTNAALNLPSYALAIKNNVSGSNNNWSYIRNTGTGSEANIEFTTGIGVAMTMAHNKNIGIGTTSPADLLSLVTSSGDCVIGLTGNSGGDPEIHMDSGNNRSGNIKYGDGSTAAMFRYQHSDIAFKFYAHNQTDVDFQIGENTSFFASCNLGIGTSTPQKKVHIEGDSGASASQLLVCGPSDTAGHTAGILLRAESGEGDSALRAKGGIFFEREAANGLGKLHLCNNNSNNNDSAGLSDAGLTITQDKKVGIGTTSPGTKLSLQDSTTNGAVQISFKNDAREWRTGVHGGINDSFTLYDNTASATRLVVDSSGNVGIGTTSPAQKLEVAGIARFTGSFGIEIDTPGAGPIITFGSTSDYDSFGSIGHQASQYQFVTQSRPFNFLNGSTSRLFIDNSGNVGIGQTSLGHKLDVNGDAKFISNSSSRVLTLLQQGNNNGNIIQFQNHNGGNVWEVVGRNNQFYIYNNALTSFALFIDPSNSNIGIGNTSPSQKLHVTGSILASSDVVAFSDKKLKENIKTLDGSKVYDMRGVSFTRKDTGKNSSGVIAQEIQKIAPELVTDNDGTLSVAYGNLTGYLIEAVKELKTEVEQLKKQIKNGNNV